MSSWQRTLPSCDNGTTREETCSSRLSERVGLVCCVVAVVSVLLSSDWSIEGVGTDGREGAVPDLDPAFMLGRNLRPGIVESWERRGTSGDKRGDGDPERGEGEEDTSRENIIV